MFLVLKAKNTTTLTREVHKMKKVIVLFLLAISVAAITGCSGSGPRVPLTPGHYLDLGNGGWDKEIIWMPVSAMSSSTAVSTMKTFFEFIATTSHSPTIWYGYRMSPSDERVLVRMTIIDSINLTALKLDDNGWGISRDNAGTRLIQIQDKSNPSKGYYLMKMTLPRPGRYAFSTGSQIAYFQYE